MKNQNIVCIFAHPDDEAFGPSGIIAKWALINNVYLICVTDGSNPNEGIDKLSQIRKKELQRSAEILGIKKIYFLKYCDGELYNNIYHRVAGDIEKILNNLRPVTILTFEHRGISGHIDHIFVSMVCSYLYRKLEYIRNIYYSAAPKLVSETLKNYFIYFPDGYSRQEVDHIEKIGNVWNKKLLAIRAHSSQKKDGDIILAIINKLPKEELFFVKKK